MNDADVPSAPVDEPRILFSSAYGGFPRFIWFAVLPFLLLASVALFVDGLWLAGRFFVDFIPAPPSVVTFVVCPLLWTLCGLIGGLEIYRLRNPQFILVSTWGVRLPKGRFTADNLAIAWDDLHATLEATNFKGWQVYEFHFEDVRNGERATVSSMLFRRYADFKNFASVLGEQMRRDWPIKGVRLGTDRGKKSVSAR